MNEGSTWRDWHFGDEPCTYREGCPLPLRTHTHLNPGPGQAVIVVYYDERHPTDSAGGTTETATA